MVSALIAVFALFSFVNAEGGKIDLPEGLVLQPHTYGHFEGGQIVSGSLNKDAAGKYNANNYKIDHVWTEDAYISLELDANYMDYLRLQSALDTKLYFSYPILNDAKYTKNVRQDVGIGELSGKYFLGGADSIFLAQAGYFKYKYNPDVHNLGEYMFRTGTYPIYYDMGFDFPMARLLGLRLATHLFKSLKVDVLLTSATTYPSMNWSLAGIADYDVAALHLVDIGLGVDFAHLFDVYTSHSFPLFGGDPTAPSSDQINQRYVSGNDTLWYTFQGTKLMGRISIDPKALLKFDRFGENDCKIYLEADIIGVKNYPDSGVTQGGVWGLVAPSYNEIWQKMPIMLGFNVPTFKTLDVLNCEIEWCGTKYYNDASNVINQGSSPIPYGVYNQLNDPNAPFKSQVKWSFYAKKLFCNGHIALIAQVARDHMRMPCAAYDFEMYNELLVEKKDLWWALKTSWMF
jgi:hypothetical protein